MRPQPCGLVGYGLTLFCVTSTFSASPRPAPFTALIACRRILSMTAQIRPHSFIFQKSAGQITLYSDRIMSLFFVPSDTKDYLLHSLTVFSFGTNFKT